VRLFIGSFFDATFAETLAGIAACAGASRGMARWVKPGNFHLTYMFLGETGSFEPAAKALDEALEGIRSFNISSDRFGAFPSLQLPRVLWMGIDEGAAALKEIAARLEARLPQYREGPFVPHVTLARVKGPPAQDFIARTAACAAGIHAVSVLRSVAVVESVLSPAGPVYRPVYTKKLI
jgi:2'-5' RNA ligase